MAEGVADMMCGIVRVASAPWRYGPTRFFLKSALSSTDGRYAATRKYARRRRQRAGSRRLASYAPARQSPVLTYDVPTLGR
eukprot:3373927-Rhodomonas_salina.2